MDLPIDFTAKLRKAFDTHKNVGSGLPSLKDRMDKELSAFDHESEGR